MSASNEAREPREVLDNPAESAYWNARTCTCGEDASAHIHPGCEGFDPDWESLRHRENVVRVPAVEGDATSYTLRDIAKLLASKGVRRISAERARQVAVEGWTPEHDDEHTNGILALAAAELAAYPWPVSHPHERDHCGSVAKHAGNRLRRLEIAGALIAAEIDRLIRAERNRR